MLKKVLINFHGSITTNNYQVLINLHVSYIIYLESMIGLHFDTTNGQNSYLDYLSLFAGFAISYNYASIRSSTTEAICYTVIYACVCAVSIGFGN